MRASTFPLTQEAPVEHEAAVNYSYPIPTIKGGTANLTGRPSSTVSPKLSKATVKRINKVAESTEQKSSKAK